MRKKQQGGITKAIMPTTVIIKDSPVLGMTEVREGMGIRTYYWRLGEQK